MFVKLKRFCHDSFSATWLNAFSYSTSSSCDLCATAAVKMSHSPTCWREKKRVQLQFSLIVMPPRSEQSCKVLAAITRPCAGVLQVWGGSLLSLTSPQTFPSTFWTSWGVFYNTCSQIYISISFKDDFRRCAFVQFIQDAERDIPVCQITHLWSINLQST